MNYDEIIDCPKSGGDLCYKTEVTKDITNYFSLSCGFWTNTLMKENSDFFNEQIEVLPELYKDLAWQDPKTKLIWLPNTINLKEKGMVFANGTDINNWYWSGVKAIADDKNEYKTDMSTIKHFKERDFIEALSYIGVLPE